MELIRIPYSDLTCKFCGSRNLMRYGTYKGSQRFLCKNCGRKSADNDALPYMQTPPNQVAAAVAMFYEGLSLNSIRRNLSQIYGDYPSDSTIYRWIVRFTEQAANEARGHKPSVGSTWIADETVLDIDGKNVWFWDIIDRDTRFLLASHISRTRTTKDAQKLMELAAERAGKHPKIVATDKLASYLDGIELAFGSDTRHVASKPFKAIEQDTNLIERFHGTLKDRTKVMRGLKDLGSARLFTEGFLVHYNYMRPHKTLSKTPAEAAGIKWPYANWRDFVAKGSHTNQKIGEQIVSASSTIETPTHTESGYRIARVRRFRPRKRVAQTVAGLSTIRGRK